MRDDLEISMEARKHPTSSVPIMTFQRIKQIFIHETLRFELFGIFVLFATERQSPIIYSEHSSSWKLVAFVLVILHEGVWKSGGTDIWPPPHCFLDDGL